MKLLTLLSNEESSFSSIAGCIATDPVLSGRLIKRANSADLASYCEARNVLQAVGVLGMERTREVSLTIAISGYAGSAIKTEILRPCWHHTLACALIASELARQCGLRPAEAYTAALLHDIGRLGLLAAYPADYEAILSGDEAESGDLIAVERDRFGVDRVEAGEWLARRWNLPESIIEVIVRHGEPSSGTVTQLTVVQIACRLADLLGFSAARSHRPPTFEDVAAPLPEWARSRLNAQLPALQAAITKEIHLFEASDAPEAESAAAVSETAPQEETISSPHTPPRTSSSFSRFLLIGAVVLLLLAIAIIFRR